MIKKNNSINHFIILLLLAFIFFDYKFASLNNQHLSWDEVNYSKASSLGFLENAFELKSKNIFEFIKLGYNKIYVKKNLPIIADLNIINQEKPEDIFELRHYHPPLYIYYLSLFHSIEISDYDLRLAHKIIGYFIIAVLFLCCLLINKNNNNFLINFLCLITLIIFFYSDLFQKSLKNLNFHSLFSLTIILFSYSLYKYVLKSNLKNSIRLSVSISIMFISLETAIFIFLSSISYIFFYKKNILLNKNFLYLLIAAFLISLILWPANFYNITIFKTYLM